jgi:hypothetical protein
LIRLSIWKKAKLEAEEKDLCGKTSEESRKTEQGRVRRGRRRRRRKE